MIEQVVDAADGKADPPPELEVIWGCQRYHSLPDAGGYLDQDARLMSLGTVYNDVFQFIKFWRTQDKPNYTDLSLQGREVFMYLVNLKVRF